MMGVIAKLTVKDGKQKEFEDFIRALAKDVRANEPGNIIYDLTLKVGSTTEYYIMEQYKDPDAVKAHTSSPHFQAAGPKFADFLDGRTELTRVEGKS
jgi:quinol monooxygenase YgiN